jgi:hypothetical protein
MATRQAEKIMTEIKLRPRKDKRGVDLISDALPFGRLWYGEPNAISNAIGYAKFYSRSHDAVIRVCDKAGNAIRNARARRRFQRVVRCIGSFPA